MKSREASYVSGLTASGRKRSTALAPGSNDISSKPALLALSPYFTSIRDSAPSTISNGMESFSTSAHTWNEESVSTSTVEHTFFTSITAVSL